MGTGFLALRRKSKIKFRANGEAEWIQNGRFRTGSSSVGFSSTDSLKILLPSSPL
jgi:hypothetical protein